MNNKKPLILGHMGTGCCAPKNTLEAMQFSIDAGADGVELDVHLSKDGYVVVCHDETINSTSNGQGKITMYTLSELKMFDFGFKYYGDVRGVKIPTLDEVYALLAPHGMIVNVEIKSSDPAIISALHELEVKYSMSDKVIYSSFDHLQLERMKAQYPTSYIAPLYSFNMASPWDYAANMKAGATHPHFKQICNFKDYVKNCHEKGINVHAWTPDSEEDIQFCLDAGCDAIITNYPDIAIMLRDK